MARIATGLSQSKRGGLKISVINQAKLKKQLDFFVGPEFGRKVMEELAPTADALRDAIRARARAQGAPESVPRSVFSYKDAYKLLSGAKRRQYRLTALVGVNRGLKGDGTRGPSYFEWVTTTGPGVVSRKGGGWSIVRKREKGTLLGMSLASVFEYGTSNRHPRPYFRPTLITETPTVRAGATAAMNRAIEAQKIR